MSNSSPRAPKNFNPQIFKYEHLKKINNGKDEKSIRSTKLEICHNSIVNAFWSVLQQKRRRYCVWIRSTLAQLSHWKLFKEIKSKMNDYLVMQYKYKEIYPLIN